MSDEENVEQVEATDDKPAGGITSLDDALKVIEKLRNENAAKRVKNKEIEDKAAKWEEYVQSQKTELEKLTESNAALSRENGELKLHSLKLKVAEEEKVAPELFEFLQGADEQTLRANAKKLAKVKQHGSQTTAVDFFAGQRGAPVPVAQGQDSNEYFRQLWHEADQKSRRTSSNS